MVTNNYSSEQALEIANTIWIQLGSQRFSFVTGCKVVCYGEKDGKVFLLMSVGANTKGITLFEVAYNECEDLYEVSFMRKQNGTTQCVANYSGVYCDMLHTLFEQHTGLSVNFKVAA